MPHNPLEIQKSLYLRVTETGSKLWRYNYRHSGKQKTLALGIYPDVSLADARQRHKGARKLLADGIDPSAERRAIAAAEKINATNTFGHIAEEWIAGPHAAKVAPTTAAKTRSSLRANVLNELGSVPITELTAPLLLATLRKVESRATYSAHRYLQLITQIYRYAIASGYTDRNIAADLKGALKPYSVEHHPAITDPSKLSELLRIIDGYSGSPVTVAALKLAVQLFVRPGELRKAKWVEIDLDNGVWSFVATKTKTPHIVPLSAQAISILRGIQPITGHLDYVFSGVRNKSRPMSENTINAALRYLGFAGDDVVGHGFRATARTILDEVLNYPAHIIEQQLAHAVRDPNGRAYNRTAHLPQRREMMQSWANYLDGLKGGAKK
jgi:integrase